MSLKRVIFTIARIVSELLFFKENLSTRFFKNSPFRSHCSPPIIVTYDRFVSIWTPTVPFAAESTCTKLLLLFVANLIYVNDRKLQCFNLFKKWAIPGLFFIYFRLFVHKLQILQQINVKKCPSSKQCRDSNSRPLEYESPPITTTPGLQPLVPTTLGLDGL